MAFNLATIRAEIGEDISTLTGWTIYETVPDNPVPPCVFVAPGDGDYHLSMQGGNMAVNLSLVLLVASAVTDEAQSQLDGLLSAGTGQTLSLIDRLHGSNLDGNCKFVHVTGWSEYGDVPVSDERRLFGVVVHLIVYCDRR